MSEELEPLEALARTLAADTKVHVVHDGEEEEYLEVTYLGIDAR